MLATDPLPEMLAVLGKRVDAHHVVASAEHLPVRSRSVDVVVCGQSFHWFDHEQAMAEIARVLRPGGVIALAWNTYDEGIPWVKRLKKLISPGAHAEQATPLMESPYFGFVDAKQFRFWQPHTAASLADLARSVSHVATMSESERADDAGQGRRVVRRVRPRPRRHAGPLHHPLLPGRRTPSGPAARHRGGPDDPPSGPRGRDGEETGPVTRPRKPPEDPGTQLIDFK